MWFIAGKLLPIEIVYIVTNHREVAQGERFASDYTHSFCI